MRLCTWTCITAITTLTNRQSLLWFAILWCSVFHYMSTERAKMDQNKIIYPSTTKNEYRYRQPGFEKAVVNGFKHGQSASVFKEHFLPRSRLSLQENKTSLFNRIRFLGLNCVNHWFPDDSKVKWHLSGGFLIGNKNCNCGLFTQFLFALLCLS